MTDAELKKVIDLERSLKQAKHRLGVYRKALSQLAAYIRSIDVDMARVRRDLETTIHEECVNRYKAQLKWMKEEKMDLIALYDQFTNF